MKKNSNRVTIKDVARLAGVTPQTVSRALSDAPDISESTRAKIIEIANSLNYVKNSTACAFRGANTKLIAVFYDNFTNLYFSIMMEYLQSKFSSKGYSLLPLTTKSKNLDVNAYKQAVSNNVDAIISFLQPDDAISSLIENYSVPVLILGRRSALKNVDCVYTDDEEGGRLVGKRLIESGCKKILYITEALTLTCAVDRYNGLKAQLTESGIQPPAVMIHYEKPIIEQFETLKTQNQMPDGVFCFNDMIAFELLYLIQNEKLPTLKVVGYDNIQGDILIPNQITTISADKKKIVDMVAKIIIDKIERGVKERKVVKFKVSLVEGVTC